MKNRFLPTILLAFILYSCNTSNIKVEKYENGNVKSRFTLENDKKSGICYEYYEDETIKSISNWKKGKKNGRQILYMPNGQINEVSFFSNGLLNGQVIKYDDYGNISEIGCYHTGAENGYFAKYHNGQLFQLRQYIIINKQSTVNQYWNFDDSGNLNTNISNYFTVNYPYDSIKVNKEIFIEVSLPAPFFENSNLEIIIGDYDSNFNLIDSSSQKSFDFNGLTGNIPVSFDEKGDRYLRGIIKNIKYLDETETKRDYRLHYFEKLFTIY